MITTFDKAIAGLIVPLLVAMLAHFGFQADETFSASLAAVVTALVVYFIPNKSA